MNRKQLEILRNCGFIKSQLIKGHMHYGKQMNKCLLVVTDTLDWYVSLPYPVVGKEELDMLKSYEVYLIVTIEELANNGSKNA